MASISDSMDMGPSQGDFFDHEPSKDEKDEVSRPVVPLDPTATSFQPSTWLGLLCPCHRYGCQDHIQKVQTGSVSGLKKLVAEDSLLDGILDGRTFSRLHVQWKRATKAPSEWLRLLCKDWAMENESLVEHADARLIEYKPYTQGILSSQLLVRLSVANKDDSATHATSLDFWGTLGIGDEFDKSYIVAQIEKFDSIYEVRCKTEEELEQQQQAAPFDFNDPTALAAAAAGLQNGNNLYAYDAAAVAAAVQKQSDLSRAHRTARETELRVHGTEAGKERRLNHREIKAKEREALAIKKAQERAAREASREERRRKKLEIRQQREKFAQEQKNAAIQRAAELVKSNRVPIEITRGAAAAKASAIIVESSGNALIGSDDSPPPRKKRSAVVVSTAGDLHQIVSHSRNLYQKYSAIAKEHNQRVNWSTVAKELGIHVKVREKYARMHNRAEARGFDWHNNAHVRIRDHPEIFMEPTAAEQKAKIPPPAHAQNRTVLVRDNKEVADKDVDVRVGAPPVDTHMDDLTNNAGVVAATLVADPIAGHREAIHEESV